MNFWLYLLIINLATLALYGLDKRAARRQAWRIPEYILLLAGLLGGTVTALLAQQLFRHKLKKAKFQLKFWAVTLVQIGLILMPPALLKLAFLRFFHF